MESYRKIVEEKISKTIAAFGPKSPLRDAIEYALTNGGKRLRPILVYKIAEGIGKGFDVTDAALAVEFFHTASLIADDLPCMDNDDYRRGVPSLHKKFGQAQAILATYALIAEGYERIRLASRNHSPEVLNLALAHATKNTGIHGATGGQYLDLCDPSDLERVIEMKTSTLFEIAFVFGWLFGGGEIEKLDEVKRAAHYFGMEFQIEDDLDDISQDTREKNYALMFGEKNSRETLKEIREELERLSLKLDLKF